MAYRRGLTTSARLFTQQRFTPSISYVHHNHEDRKRQHSDEKSHSFLQSRSYGVFCNSTNALRNCVSSRGLRYQDPRWSHFIGAPSGFLLARNISTQATPVISEVAVAAAGSCLPVAAMQHFIDGIHNFTGLNWWATIVLTTIIVKSFQYSSFSTPPPVELMTDEEKARLVLGYIPAILISLSLWASHFFALANMVKYVPSFKTGGTSWFLDLTTADSFFGLPCLFLFSFWGQRYYEYFRKRGTPIEFEIALVVASGVLAVPMTLFIPKGMLIYFVTSSLFNTVYRIYTPTPTPTPTPLCSVTEPLDQQTEERKPTTIGQLDLKKSTSSSPLSDKETSDDQKST